MLNQLETRQNGPQVAAREFIIAVQFTIALCSFSAVTENGLPQDLVVSTSGLLEDADDSDWMCVELCTSLLSLGSRA